jgi:hypothetical protein
MNSLSWLVYAADVVPRIGVALIILAVGTAGLAGILVAVGGSMREYRDYGDPRHVAGRALQRKALTRVLPFVAPLLLFAVVIPGKSTILMIAASEVGETVVKTPEAQEIFSDLKTILKQQLEALKK